MKLPQQSKGVLALVLLAFGFGALAIVVRYLSASFTLFQQLYVSLGVAFLLSLFLFPKTLSPQRLKQIPRRDWGIMFLRVVIGYLVGASLYRQALILTKISNVAFIQSIPFAGIFGWILLKEKFTSQKVLLLTVAFLGAILISVKDYSSLLTLGRGELFSFISSALFAFSYILRKWQTDVLNDKEMAQVLLFLATMLFVAASFVSGEPLPAVNWNLVLVVSLFFTGLFNTVNMYLINYGFRHVKAVLASNILTLESVFALLLAFIFYRELPTLKELIGGVLIIGSVIQMNRLKD